MILAVAGSNHYANLPVVEACLDRLSPHKVVLTNRKGLQDCAERWAKSRHVPYQRLWSGSRKKVDPKAYLLKSQADTLLWLPGDSWCDLVRAEAEKMGIQVVELPA